MKKWISIFNGIGSDLSEIIRLCGKEPFLLITNENLDNIKKELICCSLSKMNSHFVDNFISDSVSENTIITLHDYNEKISENSYRKKQIFLFNDERVERFCGQTQVNNKNKNIQINKWVEFLKETLV